jgi:hypothetical protein
MKELNYEEQQMVSGGANVPPPNDIRGPTIPRLPNVPPPNDIRGPTIPRLPDVPPPNDIRLPL